MRRRIMLGFLALALPSPAATPALAHGTLYRVLGQSETLVEFAYTDGEKMAFATFEVFGPADPRVPVRSGRTDRQGRVAFLPDQPGTWRIAVRDDEGHAVEAVLEAAPGGVAPRQGLPDWFAAASLSANAVALALLLQAWLERRRARTANTQAGGTRAGSVKAGSAQAGGAQAGGAQAGG